MFPIFKQFRVQRLIIDLPLLPSGSEGQFVAVKQSQTDEACGVDERTEKSNARIRCHYLHLAKTGTTATLREEPETWTPIFDKIVKDSFGLTAQCLTVDPSRVQARGGLACKKQRCRFSSDGARCRPTVQLPKLGNQLSR